MQKKLYTMVVIDDEKVEREGIIHFIDWEKYDVEIMGSGADGLEGLSLIESLQPDIVLTDVKMPLLDGIGMIEQAVQRQLKTTFIVLSGYGDYEYTSKAMLLGIKYYILKPCDEERLAKVVGQAKAELEEQSREKQYNEKLFTRAKLQFFKSLLTNSYLSQEELAYYESNLEEDGPDREGTLELVIFQENHPENSLALFVVDNIFTELLEGEKIVLKTEIGNQAVFLVRTKSMVRLERAIRQVQYQFERLFGIRLTYVVTPVESLRQMHEKYRKANGSLAGEEKLAEEIVGRLTLERFRNVQSYEELLLEYQSAMTIFILNGLDLQQMENAFAILLEAVYGKDEKLQEKWKASSETGLFEKVTDTVLKKAVFEKKKNVLTKREEKLYGILRAVYANIGNRQLSQQWLSKEVLFVNEDYLGRFFKAGTGQRMPDYVCTVRMETVRRLLEYDGNLTLSEAAVLTGFSEDGQYFSKVFRKYFGVPFSAYKGR